jgi:hypothetical protein
LVTINGCVSQTTGIVDVYHCLYFSEHRCLGTTGDRGDSTELKVLGNSVKKDVVVDVHEIDAERNVGMMNEDWRRDGDTLISGNMWSNGLSGLALDGGSIGAVDGQCMLGIVNRERTVVNEVLL